MNHQHPTRCTIIRLKSQINAQLSHTQTLTLCVSNSGMPILFFFFSRATSWHWDQKYTRDKYILNIVQTPSSFNTNIWNARYVFRTLGWCIYKRCPVLTHTLLGKSWFINCYIYRYMIRLKRRQRFSAFPVHLSLTKKLLSSYGPNTNCSKHQKLKLNIYSTLLTPKLHFQKSRYET